MSRRHGKPPPCTWPTAPHALTYARLYPSGWWCAKHTPNAQQGKPEAPPGPGWPIHRQPPPGTTPEDAAPTGDQHEQDDTR
ncbi:hypothetical protein [Streptomyces kebangsaanensis]|uniref:hypothetical protein n=1 Tax=Streptomyces kebangsaanensis TaxID=864058 RepID=UPI0009405945|nr:hypothetical protein [Streptomyces kebangsaanensis]